MMALQKRPFDKAKTPFSQRKNAYFATNNITRRKLNS